MMKDDDFKLLRGFADGLTDWRMNRQMDKQTFVIVELLSQLKIVATVDTTKEVSYSWRNGTLSSSKKTLDIFFLFYTHLHKNYFCLKALLWKQMRLT